MYNVLTTNDVAKELHVSIQRVRQLIADGRLKAKKIHNVTNGDWFIDRSDLDELIETNPRLERRLIRRKLRNGHRHSKQRTA